MGLFGEIDDGDGEISLDTWNFYIAFFSKCVCFVKQNGQFFSGESGSCGFFFGGRKLGQFFFDEFLPGKLWKTNECPRKINGWKMHFVIEIVQFFRGRVNFLGCGRMNYKLETFEADVF